MVIMAIIVACVANLMSEATAPCMGRPVTNAKVLIIFKQCVIPRLQPRWRRALIKARSHSHHRDMAPLGATVAMAKEVANVNTSRRKRQHFKKKKTPKKPPKQNAYEVTFKNSVLSEVTTTSGGERENHSKVSSKTVLSGLEEEGALQCKVTKKYHIIRFYVMNTDVPRILISHAALYWLGLVKVLCDNKAPRIKRQVASIDKKSDFRAKNGHFRTSTPNTGSSSQKKQMTMKMATSGKVHVPSPRMHSFKDAKIQGGKGAIKMRPGRDVNISDREQHSPEEPSVTTGKEPKTSKSG